MVKKFSLLAILSLLIMGMLSSSALASVSIAFAVFQNGGTVEGTQVTVQGSFTDGAGTTGGDQASGNITVYTYASSTSAKVQFCTNSTPGAGATSWSCAGNANSLTDGAYIFAAVHNETGANTTATTTNQTAASNITITIDDTSPTATMSLLTLSVRKGGQFAVDCSASSDNINTTPRVEVNISRDDNTEAIETVYAVRTSAIRLFTGQDLSPTGNRIAGCNIYDAVRLNTSSTNANIPRTGTTQQTFFISSDGSADLAAVAALGAESGGMSSRTKVMIGLLLGGVALTALVFTGALTLGGKKRR